jgi:hypothetical protein
MPRYINNTPLEHSETRLIHTPSRSQIGEDDEEDDDDNQVKVLTHLDDAVVRKITWLSLLGSSDEAQGMALRRFMERKNEQGGCLFKPDMIDIRTLDFVYGDDDSRIWEHILDVDVRKLKVKCFSSSTLATGLPRSL